MNGESSGPVQRTNGAGNAGCLSCSSCISEKSNGLEQSQNPEGDSVHTAGGPEGQSEWELKHLRVGMVREKGSVDALPSSLQYRHVTRVQLGAETRVRVQIRFLNDLLSD
jgi:hypothetical protein